MRNSEIIDEFSTWLLQHETELEARRLVHVANPASIQTTVQDSIDAEIWVHRRVMGRWFSLVTPEQNRVQETWWSRLTATIGRLINDYRKTAHTELRTGFYLRQKPADTTYNVRTRYDFGTGFRAHQAPRTHQGSARQSRLSNVQNES